MTRRSADDYDLTLPPFTVKEMEEANAAIQAWHSAGSSIPNAPLEALLVSAGQTLATSRRLINDLERPTAQTLPPERKHKFLATFREVLAMHAASTLDVAALRAMGKTVREDLEETGAEESEEARDWIMLERFLGEKEEMMEILRSKVEELKEEMVVPKESKQRQEDSDEYSSSSAASSFSFSSEEPDSVIREGKET